MRSARSAATRAEVVRAACCLGLIGVLFAAVAWRLVELQLRGGERALTRVESRVREQLPAAPPRGRITDRNGAVLADDIAYYEVRAEAYFAYRSDPAGRGDLARRQADLVDDLVSALLAAAATPAARTEQRRLLLGRLHAAERPDNDRELRPATAQRPALLQRKVDFLVASELTSGAAVAALRAVEASDRWPALHLHFRTGYRRDYPGGEACLGPVGFIARRDEAGELRVRLEAVDGLRRGQSGRRTRQVGVGKRRFWTGDGLPPAPPGSVVTTLDLGLQRAAHEELGRAVGAAVSKYGTPPSWAAMVLVEVASGDVLAMASFVDGAHPRAAAFAPTQMVFEPGSVVKPLLLSVVLQRGCVDWDRDRVDCREGAPGRGWLVLGPGESHRRRHRRIVDDHACGVLSPHEVLVQSSNVGAVKLGLRLGAAGLDAYAELYRLSAPTGIGLPGEASGRRTRNLPRLDDVAFTYYTGPSFCIGYEMSVTAVQMARAYLTLLSRRGRDLRLIRAVELADGPVELPPSPAGEPFLAPEHLERLVTAMAGVVTESPGATGRTLAAALRELGAAPGLVGGKTGTAVRRLADGSRVRTASFAGFAPAAAPRYLAFCVLQKERAEAFYGGLYAATAAGRLLLRALGSTVPPAADLPGRARPVRVVASERDPEGPAGDRTGR